MFFTIFFKIFELVELHTPPVYRFLKELSKIFPFLYDRFVKWYDNYKLDKYIVNELEKIKTPDEKKFLSEEKEEFSIFSAKEMGVFFQRERGTITGAKFDDVHEIEKIHAIIFFWETYDRLKEFRNALSPEAELAICTVLTRYRAENYSTRFTKYYEIDYVFKFELLSDRLDLEKFREYYEKFSIISNGGFMYSILIPFLTKFGAKKITLSIQKDVDGLINWLVKIESEREGRHRGKVTSEYFVHLNTVGRIGLVLIGDPHEPMYHIQKIHKIFLTYDCKICCVVSRGAPHNSTCIKTILIALEDLEDVGLTEIVFEDSYLESIDEKFSSIRAHLEKYTKKKWERKVRNFLKNIKKEKIIYYEKIAEPKITSLLREIKSEKKLWLYGQKNEIKHLLSDIDKIRFIKKEMTVNRVMINHKKTGDKIVPEIYLQVNIKK